jgi:hypothetical protein
MKPSLQFLGCLKMDQLECVAMYLTEPTAKNIVQKYRLFEMESTVY